jgi:dolichyl-phosphate-mannose-protein mannosyltransferase
MLRARPRLTFAAILVGALVFRLGAIAAGPGFVGDIAGYQSWAARLAAVGPAGFYDPARVVEYPPGLLYLLWPLGVVFGDVPSAVIRGLSIPFDLAMVALMFAVVRRVRGDGGGLAASALYALNPAIVLAGPYWGQMDAVATLPMMLALVAAAAGRNVLAGSLAAVAALIKPQAVLGLVALIVVGAASLARRRDARPLVATALAATVTTALLALPFAFTPATLGGLIHDATSSHPLTSVLALNLWVLTTGFVRDDRTLAGIEFRVWGIAAFSLAALLVAAWMWTLVPRGRAARVFAVELATLFAGGTLLVFALYELPTRVHERYLFPALALFAPFAVASRRALAAYAALSVVLGVAVLFGLSQQDPAVAGSYSSPPYVLLLDPETLFVTVLLGLLTMGSVAVDWARHRPALA